ncbi:mannose-6-phosphate isomerase, class I [Nesterenkonia alkaliphila]|uniref:mannose-6-phosphate isomerase n=2 Tax=Nesterenkonia alkaliphila TaxID=1463631 RepID=A0A7K1UEX5_9MICC|nr:mannose-6-phosphate isomerase, class I [Nesterenkonia alkaliphila]
MGWVAVNRYPSSAGSQTTVVGGGTGEGRVTILKPTGCRYRAAAQDEMMNSVSALIRIDNASMPYPWGAAGGISALLGREPSGGPEAELWLGAHPKSPSRVLNEQSEWDDLHQWEQQTGQRLPFLLKILDAAAPLSLQAHPSAQQAVQGFEREQSAGIPIDAPRRNYRDPRPKPEMIVALTDGFEALCGFRDPAETVELLEQVAQGAGSSGALLRTWAYTLAEQGIARTVRWLLGEDAEIPLLVDQLGAAAERHPEQLGLASRLLAQYPGDPGAAVALMLNYEVLAAGEALWLPAGNIHAYLHGTGIELMGPSDNVLRGGLTGKHIDVPELLNVLDISFGAPERLQPEPQQGALRSYRTEAGPDDRGAPFELLEITGDAEISTQSPSVVAVMQGEFTLSTDNDDAAAQTASRGQFLLHTSPGPLAFHGAGQAFLATARRASSP